MARENIYTVVERLEEYASMEGTEIGQYWQTLCNMRRNEDAMSTRMLAAWEAEVREQLKRAIEETEIVERTETTTRTIRRIQWRDE